MGRGPGDSLWTGDPTRRFFAFVLVAAIVYTGYLWLQNQYYYDQVSNLVSEYEIATGALSQHLFEANSEAQRAKESARIVAVAKMRQSGRPWQALTKLAAFAPREVRRNYYREAFNCVFAPGCEFAGNLPVAGVSVLGFSAGNRLILGRVDSPEGEPKGVGIIVFSTMDSTGEPTRHIPTWREEAKKGDSSTQAVFHPKLDVVGIYHAGRLYLWNPVADADLARAHVGKLEGRLAFDATGEFLLLGSSVFDARSLKLIGKLPGEFERALGGHRVLLRAKGSWIEYDLKKREIVARNKLVSPPMMLEPVSDSQDGIVVPMRQVDAPNEAVVLWHRRSGKVIGKLVDVPAWGKKGRVRPVLVSRNGKIAVFPDAGRTNSVVVWDVVKGRAIGRVPGSLTIRVADGTFIMLEKALSPDGRFLVLLDEAQEVGKQDWQHGLIPELTVYELPGGRPIGKAGWPTSWSRDGSMLAGYVANDEVARRFWPKLLHGPVWKEFTAIWRVKGEVPSFEVHRPVHFLNFGFEGRIAINGDVFDTDAVVADRGDSKPEQSGNADLVHFAGQQRRLFVKLAPSGRGRSIEISGDAPWKATSIPFPDYSEQPGFKPRPADGIDAFGFSSSGKYLCLAYSLAGRKEPHDVLLEVWCLAASRPFRMIDPVLIEAEVLGNRRDKRNFHYYGSEHASKERFGRVAFSDDEREVVLLGDNGNIVSVNIGTREPGLRRTRGVNLARMAVPIDFARRWLIADASHLTLIDGSGKATAGLVLDDGETVRSMSVSPGGNYAALGMKSGRIYLVDLENLEIVLDWNGATEAISAIAFSRDGRFIVTGTSTGKLRLWDLQLAEEELTSAGISLPWGSSLPWDAATLRNARDKQRIGEYFASRLTLKELRRDLKTVKDKRVRDLIEKRIDTYKEDAMEINNIAWSYVRFPALAVEEYRQALAWSLRSNELSGFNNLAYLNTLGVAYYRVGRFDKAIELLTKTYRQQSHPADIAFLAMAHARNGNPKHARRLHAELRDLQKRAALDWEGIRFLRELEAVLEGKAVN